MLIILGYFILCLGVVVGVIDFLFVSIHACLRWLRLTLNVEAARLLGYPKSAIVSLYQQKRLISNV